MTRAAAVFEARMSSAQAERLAALMREHVATRPAGVEVALLLADGDDVRLVAIWRDRRELDDYLASGEVPRGTALMREVGVEPTFHVVDCLQLG